MYLYDSCLFFMSVVLTVWGSGNVCCVAGIVEDSVLALEC